MKWNLIKTYIPLLWFQWFEKDILFYLIYILINFFVFAILMFIKPENKIFDPNRLSGINSIKRIQTRFIKNHFQKKQQLKNFKPEYQLNPEDLQYEEKISGSEGLLKENYIAKVLEKIEKNKRYPLTELEMGREGIVKLKLSIHRNGHLEKVEIVEPSTIYFNQESIRAVKSSAPFPPFPEEFPEKLEFSLSIKYVLN